MAMGKSCFEGRYIADADLYAPAMYEYRILCKRTVPEKLSGCFIGQGGVKIFSDIHAYPEQPGFRFYP
jgi:hypothetical protein